MEVFVLGVSGTTTPAARESEGLGCEERTGTGCGNDEKGELCVVGVKGESTGGAVMVEVQLVIKSKLIKNVFFIPIIVPYLI